MTGRRAFLALLALGGCGRHCGSGPATRVALNGAGATFPFPLYSKWIAEYHRLVPDVRVNYQSIGSGGGVRQLIARTVDFGASDVPLRGEEARQARAPLIHVPTAVGAVVLSYNLQGVTAPLRLTPELVAALFLGQVTRWNAPELVAVNPGVSLPDERVTVVYRSDGSGTTALFTEFLANASEHFRVRVGAGKSVRFPTGLGAKGNEGVTGLIRATPGAVSYTELAYATQNQLPRVALKNRAGQFVGPAPAAVRAAAESVRMPDALHVSLTEAPDPEAYPLAAYTYLLLYRDALDAEKGEALARFVWWATHDGQRFAALLDYTPLPRAVVTSVEGALRTLRVGGQPVSYPH